MSASFGAIGQQDSGGSIKKYDRKKMKPSSSLYKSSKKLESSISSDEASDYEVAADYYNIALNLIIKNDYGKAEAYLLKAINAISPKTYGNTLSSYYREMAKTQEKLFKYNDAVFSYEAAARNCNDAVLVKLNKNDAARLSGKNAEQKIEILEQNKLLLENTSGYETDKAYYYKKIGDENLKQNETEKAISNYKEAIKQVPEGTYQSNNIKTELAKVYSNSNMFDSAIEVQLSTVDPKAFGNSGSTNGNNALQPLNLRNLSSIYFKKKQDKKGLEALNESYRVAVAQSNVKEASLSVEGIAGYYMRNNNDEMALKIYHGFIDRLDSLISRDSNLVDVKLFQFSEDRILQLEKEKELKNELIKRKDNNNMLLLWSLAGMICLLSVIVSSWYSIRKRNRQIALQSLRREMNPHFLFNSLNSVNQFIASNNELEANKYLSSYSGLMRRIMENSNKDFITLTDELELINKYLQLEKLRFSDKFDYEISVDNDVDAENTNIPNMLIQPNLENAIWHGLRYRDTKGFLKIVFKKENNRTTVLIDDNGIGFAKSIELKTANQKAHESRGLNNVEERIKLLNQINNTAISMDLYDKVLPDTGVTVKISW